MPEVFVGSNVVKRFAKVTMVLYSVGFCAGSTTDAETQTAYEDWNAILVDPILYECERLDFFESQPADITERGWVQRQIDLGDEIRKFVERIGNSYQDQKYPSFSSWNDEAYGLGFVKSFTLDYDSFMNWTDFTDGGEPALTIDESWKVSKREWTRHRNEIMTSNLSPVDLRSSVRARKPEALIVMPRSVMFAVMKHRKLCLEKRLLELNLAEDDSAWYSVGDVQFQISQFEKNFIEVPHAMISSAKGHYRRFAGQIDEMINRFRETNIYTIYPRSYDDTLNVNYFGPDEVAPLIRPGVYSYDELKSSPFFSQVVYLASTTTRDPTYEDWAALSSGEAVLNHSGFPGRSFLNIWLEHAQLQCREEPSLIMSTDSHFSIFWDMAILAYVNDQLPEGETLAWETNFFEKSLRVKELIGILSAFRRLIFQYGNEISTGIEIPDRWDRYYEKDDSRSNTYFLNEVRQYVENTHVEEID